MQKIHKEAAKSYVFSYYLSAPLFYLVNVIYRVWKFVFQNSFFYTNYRKTLKDLEIANFIFTNESLETIFCINPNSSSRQKVEKIWQRIYQNATDQNEQKNITFENLQAEYKRFYVQNILTFWRKLPNSKDYLESEDIRNISEFEKVQNFRAWIQSNEELLNLTELDLSKSNLLFLPSEINLFKKLKRLDLSFNRLQNIPSNLNLPNLEDFFLHYNKLENLPKNLNLPNLRNFNLMGNKLRVLPKWKLPKLIHLYLSCNALTSLPDLFLQHLILLDVAENQLEKLPKLHLPKLRIFDLSFNKLKYLQRDLTLPSLEDFNLSVNQLKKIPKLSLPQLRCLKLSLNKLDSLPNLDCPNLQSLVLINNEIEHFSENFIKKLPELKIVDISANPLLS